MPDPLSISLADLAEPDGRFDRFKLIGWWDQARLSAAKVLVIGAGALGNEIVKNLAMLGVGHVVIADKDTIENSNLSRSVLYRAEDAGKPKAGVAASAAASLYPEINAHPLNGDIIHDLGAGVFRWADVVIGGLDNREARLAINRHCWRLGRPWVDGAIEVIQGVARVFTPDAEQQNACYECTMSERDWKLLAYRRSCNMLTRDEMAGGKTPTTPTIASIIAGVQVQETLKLLHDLPTIAGKGFVFAGDTADSYLVDYQRRPDCQSHDTLSEIIELSKKSAEMPLAVLLQIAQEKLGHKAILDFNRDVAKEFVCPSCGKHEDVYRSLGALKTVDAKCPHCGEPARQILTFNTVRGDEAFLDRTLSAIGIPPFDILTARTAERAIGLELTGDAPQVLGNCYAAASEDLEWI